jgi:predicted phosphohydrolase
MVYVTGDTHTSESFNKLYFEGSQNLTKNDFVIILGDIELIWTDTDGSAWINKLNDMPFTTLFLDGNYDNYEKLSKLETVQKFGGNVGILAESVFWLKRGEIYNIDGHTYLAVGGATSVNKDGRTEGVNWWADEELNDTEKEYILANAEEHGGCVDFVITHTCPTSILGAIKEYAQKDSVSEFLE